MLLLLLFFVEEIPRLGYSIAIDHETNRLHFDTIGTTVNFFHHVAGDHHTFIDRCGEFFWGLGRPSFAPTATFQPQRQIINT
jgi:hypothetical protein